MTAPNTPRNPHLRRQLSVGILIVAGCAAAAVTYLETRPVPEPSAALRELDRFQAGENRIEQLHSVAAAFDLLAQTDEQEISE